MRWTPLFALLAASPALKAQELPDDASIRAGVELRRAHRDAEALEIFRHAYDASHHPRALAQIGLAEQALGQWVAAETHVREALGTASDPWIARNRRALEEALAVIDEHLGELWIEGGVPGAEIMVDAVRVATLPMRMPVRVVAGSLALEVRAPGYEGVQRRVSVLPASAAREVIVLVRSRDALAVADATTTTTRPQTTSSGSTNTRRILAWTSLAGAVVGVGVGIGTLIVREGQVDAFNQSTCAGVDSVLSGDCQRMVDDVTRTELAETLGFVLGGALAVTSVVLFVASPSRDRDQSRTAHAICGPLLDMAGVQCAGRF